jgi:hypothetical protein
MVREAPLERGFRLCRHTFVIAAENVCNTVPESAFYPLAEKRIPHVNGVPRILATQPEDAMAKNLCKVLLAAVMFTLCAAPAFAGDVYGRVVGYDKATMKVTFIEDKLGWSNPKRPEFTVLPAKVAVLPADPGDMTPKAGGRMRVDYEKKEIIIYNPQSMKLETLPFEIVSRTDNVAKDDALVAGKKFPMVDKAKAEVTLYSRRQMNVCTIKLDPKLMTLPEATWDDGNNIKLGMEGDKVTSFTNLSKSK